jgi:organic hydroperoxide reductase OsmC/OhrA
MDFVTKVTHTGSYPSELVCQNGQVLQYSPPMEFGGRRGTMTPEDAFVGSANMCFQIVFQTVSASLGLDIESYRCNAVGDLQKVEGARKFVKIVLRPEIKFAEGSNMENLEKAIDATKKRCLVTNSMSCEVVVEPKIL